MKILHNAVDVTGVSVALQYCCDGGWCSACACKQGSFSSVVGLYLGMFNPSL